MKKASLVIIFVSIMIKILGFIRETVLAAFYGAGTVSDAFIFAFGLPSTIFTVIVTALVTGFIPLYSQIEKERGKAASLRFSNNILHVFVLVSLILAGLFLMFPEPVIAILLPNATEALLELVVPFSQITVFSLLMTCIIQLMTGFLQLQNAFVFPMMMGFPMNILIIGAILLSRQAGTWVLPIGILISYVSQAILIIAYSFRKGYRYQLILDFRDPELKRMLALALPLIIGSSTATIGDLINKAIVSGFTGGVSYLNYSTRLGNMLYTVFGTAIISVSYPNLARSIAQGQSEQTNRGFGDAFISICLFIVPATVGLILFAGPIIELVYLRGAFTESDLAVTVPVFIGYAAGLLAISLRDLLIRMYYSYQDMRRPMWNSLLMSILQAALALLLYENIGIQGVTWAMSVATIAGMFELLYHLRKKLTRFPFRHYISQFLKIAFATAIMAVSARVVYQFINERTGRLSLTVFTAIAAALLVYVGLILVLRIGAVEDLIAGLRQKVKSENE